MKEHLVELLFSLDCGSESEVQSENAMNAFKFFYESQKKVEGEANVTGLAFHSEVIPYWDNKPIKKFTKKDQRFSLGGGNGACAMLDATSQLMDSVGERLSNTPEEERPSKVICIICVFGRDNASKNCTYEQLAQKIALQRDVYKWKFFLMTDFTINMEKLGISPDDTIVIHKDEKDMFMPAYKELNERVKELRAQV